MANNVIDQFHEEAETRIFLHASYIAITCENSIIIKIPDTDVLVIGIALDSIIRSLGYIFMQEEMNTCA